MDKEINFENRITVSFGKLKKIMESLEKTHMKNDDLVSFEYIVGSCFPNVFENIKTEIRTAYTQGYMDGINAKEEMSINDIN